MELNPYEAPRADDVFAPSRLPPTGGLRRDGDLLVTPLTAVLPPRCVKCNQPMDGRRLRRKLYWHHPLVYAALLLNVLIYLILATVLKKKAVIDVGLCARHRALRRRDLAIAWALAILSVAAFVVGCAGLDSNANGLVLGLPLGLVLLLAAGVWSILRCSVIRPQKIDDRQAWLRGVGREFLEQVEDDTAQW